MKLSIISRAALALALCVSAAHPVFAEEAKTDAKAADGKTTDTKTADGKPAPKGPSLHVQCDGNPDNMGDGEMAARIVGAITLLGLFAPEPESADPKARKFGAEGVEACTKILEGEKAENNKTRRMELFLGRAIHQIEAKNFDAAIGDVAMARAMAVDAGNASDPYFQHSVGISMDQLEAAALIQAGKSTEAAHASLRQLPAVKHQFWPLLDMHDYADFVRDDDAQVKLYHDSKSRIFPSGSNTRAKRLEDLGQFADAAAVREAIITFHMGFKGDESSSLVFANAALTHALAGNWDKAAARATDARDNDKKRVAAGKPEANRGDSAELLDLYEVLRLQHDGNSTAARRMFTGRSAWLIPSLGAVMEVDRQLRIGAKPDEMIGILAKTPDMLWKEREDDSRAQLFTQDSDNKTLWDNLVGYQKAGTWEDLSKQVWYTKKSKILQKPNEKSGLVPAYILYNFYGQFDGVLLHTALMAKAEGKNTVLFIPTFADKFQLAFVRTGMAGDPLLPAELTMNVDDIITELQDVIPSPEALKIRKAAREAAKK